MKLDKKKIIIIASAVFILLVITALVIFLIKKNGENANRGNNISAVFTPDFLNVQEKDKLGISADIKIQAMTRDQAGEVTIYKIIKNDSDIVNPAEVGSISPRALSR